jgi:O-antigen ligase
MNAAAPSLSAGSRARWLVPLAFVGAALWIGPLAGGLVALEARAWAILGALGAVTAIAAAGAARLDLVLLAVNLAAIALLPAIRHRDPLDPGVAHPFYDWTLARVTAPELLFAAALAAEWLRRRLAPPLAATPRVGPVPALALALLGTGLLVGLLRGNDLEACLRDGRKIAYVVLAHWLLVRVADEPWRRRALARAVLAAVAVRALVTIGSYVADQGFHYRGFLRSSVDVGDFLGFLALIFLPAARLRAQPASRRAQLGLWLLILLGSAATLTTFSRAAWCSAPVGVAVLLLVRVRRGRRPMPRWLVASVLLGAIAAPLAIGGLAEQAVARVAPLLDPYGDSSVSYRMRELRGAAAVAAEHPIAGLGLGTRFDAGAGLIDRRRGAQTLVHNVFLWSAVKAGVIGLSLLLAILALPAKRLLRAAREGDGAALGLLALLAAFVAMGFVGGMLNQARVAVALGLITGAAQLLGSARSDEPRLPARAEPRP